MRTWCELNEHVTQLLEDGKELGAVVMSPVTGEFLADIGPAVYDGFASIDEAKKFVERIVES